MDVVHLSLEKNRICICFVFNEQFRDSCGRDGEESIEKIDVDWRKQQISDGNEDVRKIAKWFYLLHLNFRFPPIRSQIN